LYSGDTLKHLRLLKDLSQKGIANKLGISQAAYSKIEKRKNINDWQLNRILAIMHCDLNDIDLVQKFITRKNPSQ
jgi:transcriptional regulator with XRE-family HTH domain